MGMSYVKFSMGYRAYLGSYIPTTWFPQLPTHEERVDNGRKRVRSQPSTGLVFVRFGVESRVLVTLQQRRIR